MKICTYPKLSSLYKDKEIRFFNSLCKIVGYYMIKDELCLLALACKEDIEYGIVKIDQ